MQTRTLAFATGALVALALAHPALRSGGARPAMTPPGATSGTAVSATPTAATMSAVSWATVPTLRAGISFESERTGVAPTGPTEHPTPATRAASPAPVGASADELSPEARAEAALAVLDPVRRARELSRALSAWAAVDAGGALVWLDLHPEQEPRLLVQAIGEGAAADPTAATFALTYLAQDRELGGLLAGALVRALAAQGDADAAVRLASAAAPEGWSHEWATVAFTNLAYEDAATALEALAAVREPGLRRTTAAAIIAGWSERDPAELAQHADVFEGPAERTAALAAALEKWEHRDPAAAAAFLTAAHPRG